MTEQLSDKDFCTPQSKVSLPRDIDAEWGVTREAQEGSLPSAISSADHQRKRWDHDFICSEALICAWRVKQLKDPRKGLYSCKEKKSLDSPAAQTAGNVLIILANEGISSKTQ